MELTHCKRIDQNLVNILLGQLCKSEPEDRLHFLFKCKTLEEIRTPFINNLRCFLIDIIRPRLLQEHFDGSGNLLQLIIDCSKFHLLSLNQQHRIESCRSMLQIASETSFTFFYCSDDVGWNLLTYL